MTSTLTHLITEAAKLAGEDLCAAGHSWDSDGGRSCPRELNVDCSQAVYRCTRCGVHDYGEPSGPGHDDCETGCQYRHLWQSEA